MNNRKDSLPEGLPSWPAEIDGCDNCDEAIINGGVIIFDLAIYGEKKEKKETIAEKGRR